MFLCVEFALFPKTLFTKQVRQFYVNIPAGMQQPRPSHLLFLQINHSCRNAHESLRGVHITFTTNA
jgi:hypothetical protein